jgi:transcriptional regulator with XRE-family HTH domain
MYIAGSGPTLSPAGDFGGLLLRYREAACLTQEELSRKSGISVRAISDLERGQTRRPHRRSIELLTAALSLTEEDAAGLLGASLPYASARTPLPRAGVRAPHRHGSAGPSAAPPDPASAVQVPQQLPLDVRHFVGRSAELRTLDKIAACAQRGTTVVVIDGPPGTGTSALAMRWAHQVKHLFRDGQLYADLRGFRAAQQSARPEEVIRDFLAGFGIRRWRPPAELSSLAALYRSVLAPREMLIVLDNARDVAQIRPLLPGCAGCLVVVTTRVRPTGLIAKEGAHLITLDLLTETESHGLLCQLLGPERVQAEPEAARDLVRRCGRLPLALSGAASQLAARPSLPLAAFAAQIRDPHDCLDVLSRGGDPADLRAAFGCSCGPLTDAAAWVLANFGQHSDEMSLERAASLLGLPRDQAAAVLAELAAAHLITEDRVNNYRCHELLRAYVSELPLPGGSGISPPAATHHPARCVIR